ncbi:tRNA (adenosine(37)-N6)-threonylcarbamoyltransferase complex transferase subunit TsaD [Mycoplasma crocodyli]|uniref:tRNA N6-adenosine threonylcarbamoyltransferase n=1 Tax=Mycoplasma crocodyli (strain ATCC 51981 / MP145) TaxID=512564 RepID=D5E4M9_MYCCM|nr:tRNA (adenosine(37)-N6)-threonylcarbamoyltransferase complex transferase subunit TsaD [Mycoplasma crocodyli]ADE19891.1 O-sialoglycoprotein endopeptidase [Mycoplasma crocodyli MP145]
MLILGIETSHDDTSLALLNEHGVVDMISISQADFFKKYGGTIPELASREHVQNIAIILDQMIKKHNLKDISHIAYTEKPGLIGTLQIGFLFASALSLSLDVPLIPINHLYGHLFSASIDNKVIFPALCLLVSGGHTQLLLAKDVDQIEIIGETMDDAIGEVFDKVAAKSNIGFPGGPIIDKIFENYRGEFITFTKPKTLKELDFSFSGLKTQVINYIHNSFQKNTKIDVNQVVASFQKTAIDYVIEKTKTAVSQHNIKTLILGGGVSANSYLRKEFVKIFDNTIIPNLKYATDNGAMIAQYAFLQLEKMNSKK